MSNVSLKRCANLHPPVWDEIKKKKNLEVFGLPFRGHDEAISTVETHTSKFSSRNPFWTLPRIIYVYLFNRNVPLHDAVNTELVPQITLK